jgi:hypothetical protein
MTRDSPHRHPQVSLISEWQWSFQDPLQVSKIILQHGNVIPHLSRDGRLQQPLAHEISVVARQKERDLKRDVAVDLGGLFLAPKECAVVFVGARATDEAHKRFKDTEDGDVVIRRQLWGVASGAQGYVAIYDR